MLNIVGSFPFNCYDNDTCDAVVHLRCYDYEKQINLSQGSTTDTLEDLMHTHECTTDVRMD